MEKLSPNYRLDNPDGLPTNIESYLDTHFLRQLKNSEVANPKLLVVFSGGNAVGKSTLAQKIGNQLQGLVLENDAIKRALLEFNPDIAREDLNKFTWQYSMNVYKRLSDITPNGLVVRDGVIDWYYDRILPVFEAQGYQIFIIGYELSDDKQAELIQQRGDTPTVSAERLPVILEDHAIHQKRFRSIHTPDITLNDKTIFDHDRVINLLRTRLASMNEA